MKPIFRMSPKTFLQCGLYNIARNMLISSWIFHLTLKTDWRALSLTPTAQSVLNLLCQTCQACSHAQWLRKRLNIWVYSNWPWNESTQFPFRNKWHDSMGATSPQVQLDLLSRMSGLCFWTWQLVWAPNGYTILEGLTSYPGLCNKQVPSPYHAYKYIIQRWEWFKFNLY